MTLAMHRAVVTEYLRGLAGRELFYYPNPGNAGDALIAAGTKAAFNRAGLAPTVIDAESDVTGKTVIMGGGGSLLGPQGEFPAALRNFSMQAKELIILPHTLRMSPEILDCLRENVTIFVRELESFRILSGNTTRPTVFLAPDMAFHVDVQEFLADPAVAGPGRRWFDAMLKHHGIKFGPIMEAPRAYFARTDWEKRADIGGSDFDASDVFAFGIWGERGAASAWCLLNAVRLVQAVTTDRLHVGIAAALLGKDCELHDNIYGKNRNIFEYSMKFHFSNINLVSA